MAWEENDQAIYTVVVNHEEQYSIWPDYKEIPNGWRAVGKTGLKPECLSYINEVWGLTCDRSVCASRWQKPKPRALHQNER
jgi:MbtH protein